MSREVRFFSTLILLVLFSVALITGYSQSLAFDMWSDFDGIVSGIENRIDELQRRNNSQTQEIQELISDNLQLRDLTIQANNALNEKESRIARQEAELKIAWKTVWTMGIVAALIIAAKIAAFILYARRVPIPRWLDILL